MRLTDYRVEISYIASSGLGCDHLLATWNLELLLVMHHPNLEPSMRWASFSFDPSLENHFILFFCIVENNLFQDADGQSGQAASR